jgi:nucleotide-binding universal stress UspA family protein
MDQLIAAVDESAAARPVLAAAAEIAPLFGDVLSAVHVCDGTPGRTVTELCNSLDVPLHVRHGDPVIEIRSAAAGDDVRGVVLGSRGLPAAARAIGSTALELIQQLAKPVVVVPPTAVVQTGRLHRLLIPLDGTGETASAVHVLLRRLVPDATLDVVALHVFEADDIPAFSDQPGHETEAWTQEFLQRWLPGHGDVTLETRVGRAADTVRTVVHEVDADIVALGWKQDLSPGRASIVTTLLTASDVPVVLLPVGVKAPALSAQRQ